MNSKPISFLLAALLVACGGGEDGEGAAALCTAMCEWDRSCNGDDTVCDPDCSEYAPRLRPETTAVMTHCFQSLTCSESDDECFDEALQTVSVRAIDETFSEGCFEASDLCGVLDDYCVMSRLFEQVHVEAASRCLDEPCDAIEACLGDAFGG